MMPVTNVANQKYKTNLCRHFAMTGTCSIGLRCHFAHGQEELRNPNDPIDINPNIAADPQAMAAITGVGAANYSGIKCRYYELGICKYSDSCHYNHGNDNDVKSAVMDQQQLNQMMLAQQYAALQEKQKQLEEEANRLKCKKEQTMETIEQEFQQNQQIIENNVEQVIPKKNTQAQQVQNDPEVQKEITTKQLEYILQELEDMSQLGPQEKYKLRLSKELLDVKNLAGCSMLMNQITEVCYGIPELKEKLQNIIAETSELAVTLMAEYSMKFKKQQEEEQERQKELQRMNEEMMKKQQEAMQQQYQEQQERLKIQQIETQQLMQNLPNFANEFKQYQQ